MSDLALYRATGLAGDYIAGYRVPRVVITAAILDGSGAVVTPAVTQPDPAWTIGLTEQQARYELLAGTIVATGASTPAVIPAAAILASDVISIRRNGINRECTVRDLLALLGGTAPPAATFDLTTPVNAGHATGI